MPCCGGGNKKPTVLQAIVASDPFEEPVKSGEEVLVKWIVKPSGLTKYVMKTGNSYKVMRLGTVLSAKKDDVQELIERGLAVTV